MTSGDTGHRLIEDWLPINEISVEAVREGGALAGHPPVNQLHVWWARRPLIVSRAVVAASMLPEDTNRAEFISNIGTSPDVVTARRQMDEIKATGQWSSIPFPNQRSFLHNPKFLSEDSGTAPMVLDITAGGGSIPFEAGRLGIQNHRQRTEPCGWTHPPRNLRVAPEVRVGTDGPLPSRSGAASWTEYVTWRAGLYPKELQPQGKTRNSPE